MARRCGWLVRPSTIGCAVMARRVWRGWWIGARSPRPVLIRPRLGSRCGSLSCDGLIPPGGRGPSVSPLPGGGGAGSFPLGDLSSLIRHRLLDPKARRNRRSDYKRWDRGRAMELWQMDVMGGVGLTDGTELKGVTGIDNHSRFCVSAMVVRRATARPVCVPGAGDENPWDARSDPD